MTVEDKIKEMFIECHLSGEEAATIVEMMKAKKHHAPMAHRWNDNVEDYPQGLLNLLWRSAKATALEYIDATCPLAWFRSMFE